MPPRSNRNARLNGERSNSNAGSGSSNGRSASRLEQVLAVPHMQQELVRLRRGDPRNIARLATASRAARNAVAELKSGHLALDMPAKLVRNEDARRHVQDAILRAAAPTVEWSVTLKNFKPGLHGAYLGALPLGTHKVELIITGAEDVTASGARRNGGDSSTDASASAAGVERIEVSLQGDWRDDANGTRGWHQLPRVRIDTDWVARAFPALRHLKLTALGTHVTLSGPQRRLSGLEKIVVSRPLGWPQPIVRGVSEVARQSAPTLRFLNTDNDNIGAGDPFQTTFLPRNYPEIPVHDTVPPGVRFPRLEQLGLMVSPRDAFREGLPGELLPRLKKVTLMSLDHEGGEQTPPLVGPLPPTADLTWFVTGDLEDTGLEIMSVGGRKVSINASAAG